MTAIKSMHSLSNLENVDILDYIEHTVFITKKSSNLPKNSLFLRSYIIGNVIVMGSYKWYFKK